MPFYEYQCESCHHHVEVLQKISDAPLRKCPSCGKAKLKRLLSAPVFRLKGSGWYETDFKSDKEAKRNLAEHPDKEAGADKDKVDATKPADTKAADSKPADATKTESKVDKGEAKSAVSKTAQAKPVKAKPAAKRSSAAPKRKATRR